LTGRSAHPSGGRARPRGRRVVSARRFRLGGLALAAGGSIALAGAAPAPAVAASSYILCQPHAGRLGNRVAKVAPRRCDTLGAREPLAAGANLARLRWRGWGGATAAATGIELGYHLPFSKIPVTVTASQRRRDCRGNQVYSRLAARSRYGTTIRRFRPLC
jgi:hypothetical protein